MILGYGKMTNNNSEYEWSAWTTLGHPAFDNEYLLSLEEPEWWEQGFKSDDIIEE